MLNFYSEKTPANKKLLGGIYEVCLTACHNLWGQNNSHSFFFLLRSAIPTELRVGLKKPTYIFKDEDNTINCNFFGAPVPAITWTKNGTNIDNPSGKGSLVLKNVQSTDSGMYQCSASNVGGTESDQAQVTAVGKFMFLS